jgi:outer membrane protein OmpA-like peptidoglycan-associated protein
MASALTLDVTANEESPATIVLHRPPERPNVVVTAREVKLNKQVHFQHDSAEILPDSMGLIEEIAEVLRSQTEIGLIEIQGHTDDTGTPGYNQRLSQERAEAVRQALIDLNVQADRMVAKGYGQDRPLVPNVSDLNRAKNRRVQLIIVER